MNIENLVTSKDLSARLKVLGVPQESKLYWVNIGKPIGDRSASTKTFTWELTNLRYINSLFVLKDGSAYSDTLNTYSAYLSDEIGRWLPWDIVIARDINKQWKAQYQGHGRHFKYQASFDTNSLVESMGLMLEYLLKKKLLKVKELKV